MPRLSRKLRVCKWAGTLGCVLTVAAFVLSAWWFIQIGRWSELSVCGLKPPCHYLVWVTGGWVNFRQDTTPSLGSDWELRRRTVWGFTRLALFPAIQPGYPRSYDVTIPLWLLFCILLIPTLLLWHRDRRKPRPGFCRGCDYDLTGNTTGRCPECGLDIPKPPTLSEPAPHE